MWRIIDISRKDLLQLLRDRKTFLFTLFMPAVFTLLFGYAFGGFSAPTDDRLPLGFLDQDGSRLSRDLAQILIESEVVRLVQDSTATPAEMAARVADESLAAAVIVPAGFGHHQKEGKSVKIQWIGSPNTASGTTIESEVLAALVQLENATLTAAILEDRLNTPFDYTYAQVLTSWQNPPIRVAETISPEVKKVSGPAEALAHTAPGMMLQFAIAGLLVSAQLMVTERRTHCLKRILTTSTTRFQILLGHFLAIFILTCLQFTLLMMYGQVLLDVNYLNAPAAALLVSLAAAACISSLGLLIGVFARTEEQAIIFSLVPMFVLVGVGGGWVPLETVGEPIQTIGHLSPVAWGMDGFENIVIRGLGFEAALLPAAMLAGYAVLFMGLAAWRFHRMEDA